MRVVWKQDPRIAAYVAKKAIDAPPSELAPYVSMGVADRNNRLIAGLLFHGYRMWKGRPVEIQITIAAESPMWCTRSVLREIFRYCFVTNEVKRVLVVNARANKRARKLCEGLGFKLEGSHPRGWDGHAAATTYGMTREICIWLEDDDAIKAARRAARQPRAHPDAVAVAETVEVA